MDFVTLDPWEIVLEVLYDADREVTFKEIQATCGEREDAQRLNWTEILGAPYCRDIAIAIRAVRGLGFAEVVLGREERYRISEDGKEVVKHWRRDERHNIARG